jgi:ubiquinone/menaquinone biosynthesis C-methylase UbiE
MIRDEEIIEEINTLWVPVYPFMAEHVIAVSGIRSGDVLDLGPFAGGLACSLLAKSRELRAKVMDESEQVLGWGAQWARDTGCSSRLTTCCATIEPIPEASASFDLVMVRGAFFFITPLLLGEVKRVLRPGGFGWVGGGYGPLTPDAVIAPIAERSKKLNDAIGKRWVGTEEAENLLIAAGLVSSARLSTEGGIWVEVRG